MEWICGECGETFESPYEYEERHGLSPYEGPGEHWAVCPYCGSPDIADEPVYCVCCAKPMHRDRAFLTDELQWACEECIAELEPDDEEVAS